MLVATTEKKRQHLKAKQVKGTNYVEAKCSCLCNPSLLLGSLSPGDLNTTGSPRSVRGWVPSFSHARSDAGLVDLGTGRLQVLGWWQSSLYPQPKQKPQSASFLVTVEGLSAHVEAGAPLGRQEGCWDQLEGCQGVFNMCWRKPYGHNGRPQPRASPGAGNTGKHG